MRERPINLNLFSFQYPVPAIVSILHRISGIFLSFCIPFILWIMQSSLTGEAEFELLKTRLNSIPFRSILFLFLLALSYHWIAGSRHLLMDIHVADSLKGGRQSAFIVLFLFVISVLLGSYWIWLK